MPPSSISNDPVVSSGFSKPQHSQIPGEEEDDSGYNSSREVDTTSTTYSSTGDGDASSDCGSCESMCEAIEFIRAKQSLLQRAALIMQQEAAYDAATAFAEVARNELLLANNNNNVVSNESDSSITDDEGIWSEAQHILRSLTATNNNNKIEDGSASTSSFPPAVITSHNNNNTQYGARNPSHPLIQTSMVQRVPSKDYVALPVNDLQEETQFISTLPSTVFGKGQWMAQALLWSETHQRSVHDCRWQIVSDPYSCSAGLVPPSNLSMKHAVNIEQAMEVTDEPRLVTQATPPFCVVHVNRAFLLLAGIGGGTASSMIGKPVEPFFHVSQVVGPPEDKQQNYLQSSVVVSLAVEETERRTTCRIKVIPVLLDRSNKRRKLLSTTMNTTRKYYSCMSHVLIKVEDVSEHTVEPSKTTTQSAAITTTGVSARHDSHGSFDTSSSDSDETSISSSSPDKVVSTVG